MPAGWKARLLAAAEGGRDASAVRLVADDDDVLASSRYRLAHVLGRGARGEPLVGLGGRSGRAGQCLARLPRPQERARQHDLRSDAVVPQPLAELPRLLAALVAQRAELVRVAGSRVSVPHQVELHALAG